MAFTLTNFKLVKNRLPFIKDPEDAEVVEDFRLEIVYLLQGPLGKSDAEVEDEVNYNGLERSLIACIDACYMIMRKALTNIEGDATTGQEAISGRVLKRAKADVVEAEFESNKDSGALKVDLNALLTACRKNAAMKARQLGFILDICDDCSLAIESMQTPTPFIVHVPGGCGCD